MTRRILTARDQVALLAPWRVVAFKSDLVDQLKGEFHDWWSTEGQHHPDARASVGVAVGRKFHERGPIGHWPNVERFLKSNYPAAHRNLALGYEQVADLLDGELVSGKPYQTGPKALNKHGYDPKEIAAAMLLLHNQSDPHRKDISDEDQDRLTDIAQKRFQMQRAYEQRQTTARHWMP